MTLIDAWLPRAAATHPARAALVTPEATMDYAELARRAAAVAGGLRARGIESGDRVALPARSDAAFVVALHACLWLGAVAVPIDVRLGARERAAREAVADAIIDLDELPAGSTEALPRAHPPGHPALVVHTSGTTGAGTPVVLTQGNLTAAALGSAVALGLDPGERWLCTLPLSHVGGLSILTRSVLYGTTAVLHPRFEVDRVHHALEHDGVTLVSLVPTTLSRLLDAGLRRPPALRRALIGGGPLRAEARAAALEAAIPAVQTYGLTEACSQVTTARDLDDPTAGPPLPLVSVRTAEGGEILISGPTVSPSALPAAPENGATAGWLATGDLGVIDARGRLTVTGRAADTIVTGGENVAPSEIEAALLDLPGVIDAAVFGRPDPDWGERVVALVVGAGAERPDLDAVRAQLAGRLAPHQLPRELEWTSELPRTASGKLRRAALS